MRSVETWATIHPPTRRHIPEDLNPLKHRCENLKSRKHYLIHCYQRSNNAIFFKKVRTENILKIYNTLVLPTFLYGSENWTVAALQRRRIEAAEMKLLRPLAGYTIYDHKTNDYIRLELRITGILDRIDEYRRNWLMRL